MLIQWNKLVTWHPWVLCFLKVGFISRLSIILPSSGTFLVRCYSRRRILASMYSKTGFQLGDENTPLNVELRTFIESHFKCTIVNVKIFFRLGFGVKLQNLPGPRCNQLTWFFSFQRRKYTTKFEISWMHRSAWLERNIQVTISSEGSLSETILVRKYKISKSAS